MQAVNRRSGRLSSHCADVCWDSWWQMCGGDGPPVVVLLLPVGLTPLVKMHTLGHGFVPDPIHACGLRCHGMAPLVRVGSRNWSWSRSQSQFINPLNSPLLLVRNRDSHEQTNECLHMHACGAGCTDATGLPCDAPPCLCHTKVRQASRRGSSAIAATSCNHSTPAARGPHTEAVSISPLAQPT